VNESERVHGQAEIPVEDGQVRAFEERIGELRSRLLRVAYLILGQREDAEDATQRTMLRAIEAQGSFRGEAGLYTWLYRILVNQCKDRKKARSRASRHVVEMPASVEYTMAADAPSAEEVMVRAQNEALVRAAIDMLPAKLREILVLRHYEDLSYEEIAAILNCPIGTVRSRLAKSRDRLRQILEEQRAEARR